MNYYEKYQHLIGLPYDDGDADCYGLCRRFYADNYGIELPNYARSADFFDGGVDLVTPFLSEEKFAIIDVSIDRLEVGDGLLLCVPIPGRPKQKINHVGVFVGNRTFLHHMYLKPSCEDAMTPRWFNRVMAVIRHPEIAEANAKAAAVQAVNVLDLIPDHVKQRYGIPATPVLGSDS